MQYTLAGRQHWSKLQVLPWGYFEPRQEPAGTAPAPRRLPAAVAAAPACLLWQLLRLQANTDNKSGQHFWGHILGVTFLEAHSWGHILGVAFLRSPCWSHIDSESHSLGFILEVTIFGFMFLGSHSWGYILGVTFLGFNSWGCILKVSFLGSDSWSCSKPCHQQHKLRMCLGTRGGPPRAGRDSASSQAPNSSQAYPLSQLLHLQRDSIPLSKP